MNHTIIAPPLSGWTDKVFPNLPKNKRIEKFWDTIFEICRVKDEDPIATWEEHIRQLSARSKYLNQKKYVSLKLDGPGTDLTIGLPKGHLWGSARFRTQGGIDFVGNIPTEEVFSIPDKEKTEGVVTATKPKYIEVLLEDFKFTFSKGRVVKATAKNGEEFLNKYLKIDEGASRLGEVALVPHSSPISQSGLLFYNTLIDENASCHLALGQCLRMCIKDGEKMSDDELSAAGGNTSGIHLDFMIGSDKMNVDGVLKNEKTEPIMRNGEWAFKV